MKVLIIEDERRSANRLAKLIETYDPSIEIIGRIDSIKNAIAWFESNPHPDLVFMDIQLADGICFDIFEETELTTPVIFTTAFDEYAIKAFKVNSIDYLLKPFGYKDLKGAMDKFFLVKNTFSLNKEQLEDTKTVFTKSFKSRFLLKTGIHIHSVPVEVISCVLSNEKTTYLYTGEGKRYVVDYSLDQIESLLSPEIFFRVSRKFLINMNFIEDILIYPNSRLKILLKNFEENEELVVSREKVNDFKNWLDK